jgi:hypothetical protein
VITALLLLPVTAVLAWLYRQALPRGGRWNRFDTGLLFAVAAAAAAWVAWARSATWHDAGPIYPELAAAAGAYPIIVIGLAAGLTWRRQDAARRAAQRPGQCAGQRASDR